MPKNPQRASSPMGHLENFQKTLSNLCKLCRSERGLLVMGDCDRAFQNLAEARILLTDWSAADEGDEDGTLNITSGSGS